MRVLFSVTIIIGLASRTISAQSQGQFVPELWTHQDWIFFCLLSAYIPTLLFWPLIPWAPTDSARRRAFSYFFIASTVLLIPVLDFGHYLIIVVSVTHALYAHNVATALVVCLSFGLVNFAAGASHPAIPLYLAAMNGALLLGYCLGVLIVVGSLITSGRRAQHTKDLLDELTEAHRQLRHYSARIRELAVEEERGRMAREMHDSTGHYLTAISLCLTNAQRSAADSSEALREELSDARSLAKEALAETRRWVRALKPLDLENLHGPEALRSLTVAFGTRGVSTGFHLVGAWPDDMDGEVELALYRTVQEGLTNALRYSRASRIDVNVTIEDRVTAIEVIDNGVGTTDGPGTAGFGLSSLKERLASLGGRLQAGNHTGGGFRLLARVPFHPAYLMEERT